MTNSAGPTPADRYPRDKMRFSPVKATSIPAHTECPDCGLVMMISEPTLRLDVVPHETNRMLTCGPCNESYWAPTVMLERVEQQG